MATNHPHLSDLPGHDPAPRRAVMHIQAALEANMARGPGFDPDLERRLVAELRRGLRAETSADRTRRRAVQARIAYEEKSFTAAPQQGSVTALGAYVVMRRGLQDIHKVIETDGVRVTVRPAAEAGHNSGGAIINTADFFRLATMGEIHDCAPHRLWRSEGD